MAMPVTKSKKTNKIARKMIAQNLFNDALYYLCDNNTDTAHGVIVGLVSCLMAMGYEFQTALEYCAINARGNVRFDSIPESWRADFIKYYTSVTHFN